MDSIMHNIRLKYFDGAVIFRFAKYGNGAPALLLESPGGSGLAIATVNVHGPGYPPKGVIPAENSLIIKSWSENEGMADALMHIGFLEPIHQMYPVGYKEATEHKMAGPLLQLYKAQKGE